MCFRGVVVRNAMEAARWIGSATVESQIALHSQNPHRPKHVLCGPPQPPKLSLSSVTDTRPRLAPAVAHLPAPDRIRTVHCHVITLTRGSQVSAWSHQVFGDPQRRQRDALVTGVPPVARRHASPLRVRNRKRGPRPPAHRHGNWKPPRGKREGERRGSLPRGVRFPWPTRR